MRPSPGSVTLLEAFAGQAKRTWRGIRLMDERGRAVFMSYRDLLVEASTVARGLDRAGLRPGDRIMVLLPTCRSLVSTILGAMLRGVVPLPGEPGGGWGEEPVHRSLEVAEATGVGAVVTAARRISSMGKPKGGPRLLPVESLRQAQAIGAGDPQFKARPEDPALMFLPGGLGAGRAPIVLTHEVLANHLRALGRALRTGEREVLCGFASLDTVTGLVDQLLFALFHGFDAVLLAPDRVYSQPARWIHAISRLRCTMTMAETTDYGHLAHQLGDRDLDGVDLTCLRRAVTLGSPLRPGTHEAFIRRFSGYGVAPDLFLPGYSVPGAGGIVTLGRPGARPLSDRFDRRSLRPDGFVHTAGVGDSRGRIMMSSGMPLSGVQVWIRSQSGEPLDEGRVGRVVVRFAAGSGTRDVISGDLGFLMQGELFVVGSEGEGLDLDGYRYDPEELEAVAGEVPGIRKGGVAAFVVAGDDVDDTRPVVVAAPDRGLGRERRSILARRVGVRIGRMIGVRPEVVLVSSGRLPRRGKGPRYREGWRERYLDEDLDTRVGGDRSRASTGDSRSDSLAEGAGATRQQGGETDV